MGNFVFDPEYASQMLQRDFPDLLNKEQADAIAHLTAILERRKEYSDNSGSLRDSVGYIEQQV